MNLLFFSVVYCFLISVLYVVVFSEKLKYAGRLINMSAEEIISELKVYCEQCGEKIEPEVFLRRLSSKKDIEGNPTQYNSLSHITKKRASLIFDAYVNDMLKDVFQPSDFAEVSAAGSGSNKLERDESTVERKDAENNECSGMIHRRFGDQKKRSTNNVTNQASSNKITTEHTKGSVI